MNTQMTPSRALPRVSGRSAKVLFLAGSTLLVFLAIGLVQRLVASASNAESSTLPASPAVSVATVVPVSADVRLALPGTLRAWQDTPLYARAEGYLVRLHVDIGDEVRAGQLLAEIDTPDLDQELAAARAQTAQAEAQLALAESTDRRYQSLLAQRSVSEMEADRSATALRAGHADLNLARARLNRLEELSRFKRVTAPFAGRITRRQAEPGVLVGPSTPLFQLAAIDRLRVQVQVPQSYMRSVAPGLPARLAVREFANQTFEGKVTRTSGSLDGARTMTAEIELDNSGMHLMPGIYAEVNLTAPTVAGAVLIPANALIVNQHGTQVAVVGAAGVLKLQPVRTGRDLGSHVEVLDGVSAGARIVTNPPDTLREGITVQVRAPSATSAQVPP